MELYYVIYTGDEAGLYFGSQLVASHWQLGQIGLDVSEMIGWSQLAYHKVDCRIHGAQV
jgi:hypothetical protein